MTRYIWDDDAKDFVPREEYFAKRPRAQVANVIGDVEPHWSPAADAYVTSRSQIREACRKHGLVEVGNEKPRFMR